MKSLIVVFAAGSLLVAACGDDSTEPTAAPVTTTTSSAPTTTTTMVVAPDLTIDDLVGTWTATAHVFSDNADATRRFDTIANGGETRITVLEGGRARTWVTIGDVVDEFDSLLRIDGGTLISTPAEAGRPIRTWVVTVDGDTVTLTDARASFDFDGSGEGVPATETIVLARQ